MPLPVVEVEMHQQNPMRALVVEDEFMIRLDLEQLLAGFGFPVDGFADPRSAEATPPWKMP